MNTRDHNKRGVITISVLVFAAIFGLITASLASLVLTQSKAGHFKESQADAFELAEAGLSYYKWFLAHHPGDYQNGTGEDGPYVQSVDDPEGGTVGSFSLDVNANLSCGAATSMEIRSTGIPGDNPSVTETVYGRYSRPSVAEYAYIVNSNVWAGEDRVIKGPYHSNGGIRMDATTDSIVTSSVETWQCSEQFGCSYWTETKPGVFGSGSGSALWEFPVPSVDFVGLTVDLRSMKSLAQANGIYLGAAGGQSNKHGWHLVFKSDGTVDIYKVRNTQWIYGRPDGDDREKEYNIITDEDFVENEEIPSDCGVIFVEDKLWIEGTVKGKVTVAAAKIQQGNFSADIILNGNINYAASDGSDGLTAIAENNILIPLLSPENMSLRGVFIAQNGHFGRNYYATSDLSSSYDDYVKRGTLTIHGTIVSNGRIGTKWISGGNTFVSGYENRVNSYDRLLANNPPPLTPYLSQEYRFVEWRDESR